MREEEESLKFKSVKTFEIKGIEGIEARKIDAKEQEEIVWYEKQKVVEDPEGSVVLVGMHKESLETKISNML